MSDLIRSDELVRDITEKIEICKAERAAAIKRRNYNDVYFYSGEISIARRIRRYVNMFATAVDAVPVVHAALESTGMDEAWCEWGDCTNCGHSNIIGSKYCNKCGAKVDGGEANGPACG